MDTKPTNRGLRWWLRPLGLAVRRVRGPWSRFSLRSFLILVSLTALAFASVAYERAESRRELQIVEQLRAAGADVRIYLRAPFDDSPRRRPWTSQEPIWWNRLTSKIFGQKVWRIEVRKPPSNLLIGLFKTLQSLRERETFDVAPITELKNLEHLSIYGWDDVHLPPLDNLQNVTDLLISGGTSVRDFSPIASLTNLQKLKLSGSNITDLAPLAGLKRLEYVDLRGTTVSDLTPLFGLDKLETILIDDTRVSDLTPLAGLKNLQWVFVRGSAVGITERAALQQSLPNCQITP